MTDNFKLYRAFMEIPESRSGVEDRYYVVELIRRGKDNPGMRASNYHFRNYYIYCKEQLDKYEEEIKTICETFGMRAYASVNYKSEKQVMLDTCAEYARRIAMHDYKKPQAIFESCSGKYVAKDNKCWIVDCDECDSFSGEYICVKEIVEECTSKYDRNIIAEFPTRNGMHLITHPFNVKQFREKCEACDVKFNHLTLLYENL